MELFKIGGATGSNLLFVLQGNPTTMVIPGKDSLTQSYHGFYGSRIAHLER